MKFKKNKVIISSLIGLTALTVCGVGFSAWVIGLNQPTITLEGMGVEIDTITEETCYLNMTVASNEKIVIANPLDEGVADGVGNGIGAEFGENGPSTCDLDIALTNFDFAFASDATFNSLKFEATVNGEAIQGTTASTDLFGRGNSQTLPYITLANYNNVGSLDSVFTLDDKTVTGYDIYTANDPKKLSFTWGSFFGNEDPATFYQNKIKAAGTTKNKLAMMNQARDELEAMDAFFKNDETGYHTLKIVATLDITPAN